MSTIRTPLTATHKYKGAVYEPAEDSFLLLDALELELEWLQSCLKPVLCLEVGSGSGIISVAIVQALDHNTHVFCTDINSQAVAATFDTFCLNNIDKSRFSVVQCDGIQFAQQFQGQIDLLLCNPPYVPTEVVFMDGIEAAWSGGPNGRWLIDKLICLLPQIISPIGVAYIVVEDSNNPLELIKFAELRNLSVSLVIKRHVGGEVLSVLKIVKRVS